MAKKRKKVSTKSGARKDKKSSGVMKNKKMKMPAHRDRMMEMMGE